MKFWNNLIFLIKIIFFKKVSTESCMILSATHYFGGWNSGSCFSHSIDILNEIFVHSTNESIYGLSFGLKKGINMSYIENSGYNQTSKVDLKNSIISGINVLIGSIGITGLQFQTYDGVTYKNTLAIGSEVGCSFFIHSNFMSSNYLKIDAIGGCINLQNLTEIPSLKIQYSFSQCSFLNIVSQTIASNITTIETTTLTTTSSSTSETTILTTTSSSTSVTTILITTSSSTSETTILTTTSSSTITTSTSSVIIEGCLIKSNSIQYIFTYLKNSNLKIFSFEFSIIIKIT
jgi:hypothetical protein